MWGQTAYLVTFNPLTAFQSPMWPVDDIFVLPGVITSLCLDTVSARTGVGNLLLPTQLPGTNWAMISMIRRLALTVSYVCLFSRVGLLVGPYISRMALAYTIKSLLRSGMLRELTALTLPGSVLLTRFKRPLRGMVGERRGRKEN